MKYYLINNKIMKASSEMPIEINYNDSDLTMYHLDYEHWHQSLQSCSITDGELEKIINKLFGLRKDHLFLLSDKEKERIANPIEVTDFVEEVKCETYKCDACNVRFTCCNAPYSIVFKQPKSEANEAVEFLIWVWLNKYTDNNDADELYEIFITRNNK